MFFLSKYGNAGQRQDRKTHGGYPLHGLAAALFCLVLYLPVLAGEHADKFAPGRQLADQGRMVGKGSHPEISKVVFPPWSCTKIGLRIFLPPPFIY